MATSSFGLVSGRVTALALDPADTTGNRFYLGTTGGGVWVVQNAAASNAASLVFTPLTDNLAALNGVHDASVSIGALTVQPGGTGVVLAGTGDPNDVLDSYYGCGILRSTDGGNTWSLITRTDDVETGQGEFDVEFRGEGFSGFAWSTVNPQLVVAAVSQAYEGALVNALQLGYSYEGLYYSSDGGATWHLATITDSSGNSVQGPFAAFASPDGNAATSVVWNPVRKLFIAAVRFHGYYQSTDGISWTRMSTQPGSGLTTSVCPTNPDFTGSVSCPIYRGTLAVNSSTGDTFAWTVDLNNQDQGLWQDQCAISAGSCASQVVTFGKRWSTSSLESSTTQGPATIANGSYTLAMAAVPAGLGAGQDTLLLAGVNDLWKCSLAMGCVWRNTTNSTTCQSAQVGWFQHAIAWNASNPAEVFVGNDSGLWRSTDTIGETGQACSTADASHFQNLNGSLGSVAEVVSLSVISTTPYSLMAGLGVNGTAGLKSTAATTDWPQILGGYGGPVAETRRIASTGTSTTRRAFRFIGARNRQPAHPLTSAKVQWSTRAMLPATEPRCRHQRRSWSIPLTRPNCWWLLAAFGAVPRMEAVGQGTMPSAPSWTSQPAPHLATVTRLFAPLRHSRCQGVGSEFMWACTAPGVGGAICRVTY